jgi:hypothetical protein
MGYTHYFTKTAADREDSRRFEMFARGARTIIDYATTYEGIKIGDLEISDEIVTFNGVGEESHETFYWAIDGSGFNFCKTAAKPYDTVVTACLIHLKDVYGDLVDIGSDGSWADWALGARLYRNATGLTAENFLKRESVA